MRQVLRSVQEMLDKELYRDVYQYWQSRSQADEEARLLSVAQLSSDERWSQFQALLEFSLSVQPLQNPHERAQKLLALEKYYEAIRQLQAWRNEHGQSA